MKKIILLLIFACLSCSAQADPLTFQYSTTVDTTSLGGGPNTSLVVTYTFDSTLANGTGPFAPNANGTSYGPVNLTLKLGSSTITGSGGGITLFNDVPITSTEGSYFEDGYDVRAANYSGTLYGKTVSFFRFLIVSDSATAPDNMLSDLSLPTTPDFAARGGYQQIDFSFSNGAAPGGPDPVGTPPNGPNLFAYDEFHDTPSTSLVPFQLIAVPEPSVGSSFLVLALGGWAVWRLRGRLARESSL